MDHGDGACTARPPAAGSAAAWLSDALAAERGAGLDIHLQPVVHAGTGRLAGCEALTRSSASGTSGRTADQLVDLATAGGLLHRLTASVVAHAAADASALQAAGLAVPVSVNVPAPAVESEGFLPLLLRALERHALPVDAIVVELTERQPFTELPRAVAAVRALRDLGIHVAVDDYGAGHSTAGRLAALDVDVVKVDRGVVAARHQPHARALLADLLATAGTRGLVVVAEGVEDAATAADCRALGVDLLQGFAVAPAMALDDLVAWARSRPPAGSPSATR